jgi:hypothetical protein
MPDPTSKLAVVATVYEAAIRDKPTMAVASHFGISVSAAAKLVYRARDAGLLAPAGGPGKALPEIRLTVKLIPDHAIGHDEVTDLIERVVDDLDGRGYEVDVTSWSTPAEDPS